MGARKLASMFYVLQYQNQVEVIQI